LTTEPIYAESPAAGGRSSDPVRGYGVSGLGSIEFRVLRSGSPARRMRLNSTRCTLGSGEGCTVRLHDPSLRAMHAVILRDSNRVLLRAYTVPIEVNGHLTGETFLHLGDSFRLGSYHFQLVDGIEAPIPESAVRVEDCLLEAFEPAESFGNASSFSGALGSSRSRSVISAEADPSSIEADTRTSVRNRPRLSFQGGESFVSEAVQGFVNSSAASLSSQTSAKSKNYIELATSREPKAELEQLQTDLAIWKQKEQDWKEQQSRTNHELELAISRFHQSQTRADEASDAVTELRVRIDQLTSELESLVRDSREFRQREKQLRESADVAAFERERAVQERDEAMHLVELTKKQQAETELRNEIAFRDQQDALSKVALISREREVAIRDQQLAIAARSQDAAQVQQANQALTNANQQLQALTEELALATAQLNAAKEEAGNNHRRINELMRQADAFRDQAAQREQSNVQTIRERDQRLTHLQAEIQRLESECADARQHAATASDDRKTVESLQSRLSLTESQRQTDRLSWEQEAESLQQTIQQLSIEVATVTGQWQQAQATNQSLREEQAASLVEYEATQTELNLAYERLTVARRELTTRPTPEQWDELQNKLSEAETLLEESGKQLAALRLEYNELLGRQTQGQPSMPDSAPRRPGRLESAQPRSSALPFHSPGDDAETDAPDQGWPTYGKRTDLHDVAAIANEHPFAVDETDPAPEDWSSKAHEVADRLRSYTSRDELQRPSLTDSTENVPSVWQSPVADTSPTPKPTWRADQTSSPKPDESSGSWGRNVGLTSHDDPSVAGDQSVESSSTPSELRDSASYRTETADEEYFDNTDVEFAKEQPTSNEPELSSFAQRLIAELDTSRTKTLSTQSTKIVTGDSTSSWSPAPRMQSEVRETGVADPTENHFAVTFPEQNRSPEETTSAWQTPGNIDNGTAEVSESVTSSGRYTPISEMDQESFDRTYVLTGKDDHLIEPGSNPHSSLASAYLGRDAVNPSHDDDDSEGQTRAFDFKEFDSKPIAAPLPSATYEPAKQLDLDGSYNLVGSAKPSPKVAEEQDEDDSIEAYMNRLLQRVQGHSTSSTDSNATKPASPSPVSEPTSKFTSSTEVLPRDAETVTLPKPAEIIDPNAPLIPRSQAPEAAKNLAAMRELANSSANSAISLSVRGQAQSMKSRAVMDLLQGAVVLICAFAFFACGVQIPSLRYVWFTAAALAAALSIFFVLDMIKKLAAAKTTYDKANSSPAMDTSDDEPTLPM
jgi:hypothetical protein